MLGLFLLLASIVQSPHRSLAAPRVLKAVQAEGNVIEVENYEFVTYNSSKQWFDAVVDCVRMAEELAYEGIPNLLEKLNNNKSLGNNIYFLGGRKGKDKWRTPCGQDFPHELQVTVPDLHQSNACLVLKAGSGELDYTMCNEINPYICHNKKTHIQINTTESEGLTNGNKSIDPYVAVWISALLSLLTTR